VLGIAGQKRPVALLERVRAGAYVGFWYQLWALLRPAPP